MCAHANAQPLAPTHELIATCDPQFVEYATDEINADAPGAQSIDILAPGVLHVVHGLTFEALAREWALTPPVFVRHICPVHLHVPLQGVATDLETLAQFAAMELAPRIDDSLAFSVQTRIQTEVDYRPFAVNEAVAGVVAEITGAPLDVRAPQQVLSIVIAREPTGDIACEALMGVSTAVQNLSDWAGGVRRFAREPEQISRSEFKLLEALDVFGIELLPRSTALDLGASPGGWTRVLRAHELYVTAVDPGALDERLQADRAIRYRAMRADDYLRSEPDPFDLIVNDMRMDARDSARLMVRFAPFLYPHGMVIMTLKLPQEDGKRVLDHALKILSAGYSIEGVRQLFHNRSEVTVVLRGHERAHRQD